MKGKQKCRFCGDALTVSMVDLGMSPMSNSYLKPEHLRIKENFYPLHAYVCSSCFLVQLEEYGSPESIFSEYAYFSSYSKSWLDHAKRYVEQMSETFRLDERSQVVEIASNDGYLLQYFVERGVPVLGVEPAANVAEVARAHGVPTRTMFFGRETAEQLKAEGYQADLLLGNNVLAHVPQLNDFVAGLKVLLKPSGVITMEFPHLLRLMKENQFDTIYHEHFSYFSFLTVQKVFAAQGLQIFDVEELPTHGGSLRIYAQHEEDDRIDVSPRVAALLANEREHGLHRIEVYQQFEEQVRETKRALLSFLIEAKRQGKQVVGYGAAAKGNTLMNYCGIRQDFLEYTVDRSEHKQGLFLPGTHLPIYAPEKIRETRPDYVLILPWNIKAEIMEQMSFIREWGGKFVVPIPEVQVM